MGSQHRLGGAGSFAAGLDQPRNAAFHLVCRPTEDFHLDHGTDRRPGLRHQFDSCLVVRIQDSTNHNRGVPASRPITLEGGFAASAA